MATQCVDISADKNISQASPFAMAAFVVYYIVLNFLMEADFLYFIFLVIGFVICQVLFQFSARTVFLTMQFFVTHQVLTPTFKDAEYHPIAEDIPRLNKLLEKYEDD